MASYARRKDDQNGWNALFSVLFAALLFAAGWTLWHVWGGFPQTVNWFDALLLIFATFRVTRLLIYDRITRFAREWFMEKKEVTRGDGSVWVEVSPRRNGIRATIYDLLQCPWCVGVWVALALVFAYYLFAWAWFVIFILAIAGAASYLQVAANRTGWKAEQAKLDVLEKESDARL